MSAQNKSILTNCESKSPILDGNNDTDPQIYYFQSESDANEQVIIDVDKLSSEDLRNSLARVKANPIEPFSFLGNIIDDSGITSGGKHLPNTTDIDIQIAILSRRIRLNKSVLERANKRVKDINFLVEQNGIIASKVLIPDEKSPSIEEKLERFDELYPGIDKMKQAVKQTIDTLTQMKELVAADREITD